MKARGFDLFAIAPPGSWTCHFTRTTRHKRRETSYFRIWEPLRVEATRYRIAR